MPRSIYRMNPNSFNVGQTFVETLTKAALAVINFYLPD